MALSRILSRSSLRPPTALTTHRRHRSSKSRRAQLIEVVEVDQADSAEVITLRLKKLEDAIHGIIVRRSAPDWLPFLPGYSYWVPPRSSAARHSAGSMIGVVGKLAAASAAQDNHGGSPLDMLSEDENMSFTSSKGWPASSFYIEGTSPVHPVPLMEFETKIQDNDDQEDDTSSSEDEQG